MRAPVTFVVMTTSLRNAAITCDSKRPAGAARRTPVANGFRLAAFREEVAIARTPADALYALRR